MKDTVRRLPLVVSKSSIETFQRCRREYRNVYILGRVPKEKSDALLFGSLWDAGMKAWWGCDGMPVERLNAGAVAMKSTRLEVDEFEIAKACQLLVGYTARWGSEGYDTVKAGLSFSVQIHGATLIGEIDSVAKRNGETFLVEHKTTSSDLSGGSSYWRHISSLDSQVSIYNIAAEEMGLGANLKMVYDVTRKPTMQPLKATPEESRKYTKPTKAEPVPRLYANMREEDETVEEYSERLAADIASKPEFYYGRATILRLEKEIREASEDIEGALGELWYSTTKDSWPRATGSCKRYGRYCEYHDVCSGIASLDDDTRFQDKEGRGKDEAS